MLSHMSSLGHEFFLKVLQSLTFPSLVIGSGENTLDHLIGGLSSDLLKVRLNHTHLIKKSYSNFF